MIKTYVDANVLIAAFRSEHPASGVALALLGAVDRTFVATTYLRLETLRKPLFYQRQDEIEFMETYFASVAQWVQTDDVLVEQALKLAGQLDLGALDALHASAALQARVDTFVTLERPSKALFRVPNLNVVSLLSAASTAA